MQQSADGAPFCHNIIFQKILKFYFLLTIGDYCDHDESEFISIYRNTFQSVNDLLGDKKYLAGNEPIFKISTDNALKKLFHL